MVSSSTMTATHYVLCNKCGENLGDYRMYYAQEHLEKYPDHSSSGFSVLPKKEGG
jgi:hypothetical protein